MDAQRAERDCNWRPHHGALIRRAESRCVRVRVCVFVTRRHHLHTKRKMAEWRLTDGEQRGSGRVSVALLDSPSPLRDL